MQEIERLAFDIISGARAAHAYIVEGRPGEERDSFVTRLAQGLECTAQDPSARPCGRCPSCRQIAAGTSLDVVRMNKSTGSSKTGKASYRTSDAADLIERLSMGAYGRFLIGIIDDADSLSEVVQNKLLKTLEEPGSDTVIILAVSNRDNLLSTVRSRCSELRLADHGIDEEDERTGEEIAGLAAVLAGGKGTFHEFREGIDKHVKDRNDALRLLDEFEDIMRNRMISGEAMQKSAEGIELAAEARMDIHREMTPARALKRLFLELR